MQGKTEEQRIRIEGRKECREGERGKSEREEDRESGRKEEALEGK